MVLMSHSRIQCVPNNWSDTPDFERDYQRVLPKAAKNMENKFILLKARLQIWPNHSSNLLRRLVRSVEVLKLELRQGWAEPLHASQGNSIRFSVVDPGEQQPAISELIVVKTHSYPSQGEVLQELQRDINLPQVSDVDYFGCVNRDIFSNGEGRRVDLHSHKAILGTRGVTTSRQTESMPADQQCQASNAMFHGPETRPSFLPFIDDTGGHQK